MSSENTDHHWMTQALALAHQARDLNEVPVGAVVVKDNQCIGQGYNQVYLNQDPCAHAEIMAIRQACQFLHYERLTGATLYVTLEPCIMCVGALLHARIKRLVFATRDLRAGAAGSQLNLTNALKMYPSMQVDEGLHQRACQELLQYFFKQNVRNQDHYE